MKLVIFAASLAVVVPAGALARDGEVVAVLELRSRLEEPNLADVTDLAERVRDVAKRQLPEARVLADDERIDGADLVVSGEVLRIAQGLLVSLELRETETARLVGAASAAASTPQELGDAVASAAVDLFRGRKAAAAVSFAPPVVPETPAPSAGSAAGLDADAGVLLAWDEARSAEARGKDRPEEVAAAWRAVAELDGENPLREVAAARAKLWHDYGASKRSFEAHLARDTGRLRKVLPLASVTEPTRIELLVRYARAYGAERALPLVALLPVEARARARQAVGCEAKEANKCLALARAADEAKDAKLALEYLDRACAADAAGGCAEAGDRWLRADTRDVARAIPALQRGCGGGNASACSRLARVYEEGEGIPANVALAAEMREKACTAGDGKSCRKLACAADEADKAAAAALWQKGCSGGDALSCTIAQLSKRDEKPATTAAHAASTASAAESAPKAPAAPSSAVAEESARRKHRGAYALIGIGTVAAATAVFIAAQDGHHEEWSRFGNRGFMYQVERAGPSTGHLALAVGLAGLLSVGTGIGLLLTRPDPEKEKPSVAVGLAPRGLVLSGTIP
jgi:TPR repeat protein